MRLHLALEDEVLAELDRKVGPRQRSAFVVAAVQAALADERRWVAIAPPRAELALVRPVRATAEDLQIS